MNKLFVNLVRQDLGKGLVSLFAFASFSLAHAAGPYDYSSKSAGKEYDLSLILGSDLNNLSKPEPPSQSRPVVVSKPDSKSDPYGNFFKAIRANDPIALAAVLRSGFDVNSVSPEGESGLMVAIRTGSTKVLPVLFEAPNLRVETRNPNDESPLMLAALRGQAGISEQLVAMRADVNKPGWTPLHYAASGGHLEVVKILLEHGARVNAESPNGTTPLMMAARYGNAETVDYLLDMGADPKVTNKEGLSAYDFATGAGRTLSADLISIKLTPSSPDHFFRAIKADSPFVLAAVLKNGFDVNTLTSAGETGLMVAAREKAVNVVPVLLAAPDVRIDAYNSSGENALMLAALNGQAAICRLLIEANADLNKPGWTPLHYAVVSGDLPTVALLLERSAYIDAESSEGITPLMMAAKTGDVPIVEYLIKAGADIRLINRDGWNAHDFALETESYNAAEIIAAALAWSSTALK